MSIFLNKDSKVIVQGITGGEGSKHTALMLKAGTKVVGGVNARKAGETVTHGDVTLPVFGTVDEAMRETGADVSIVFVPPAFAPPPMSRKFAGLPPTCSTTSHVDIASPAPLAMIPLYPSRPTY